ncbi:endosialidase [Candidatus Weimeria sp. HCP3S3_B5]|jgi:hypothetical protein|uniref:endosialidase n=1 Tax=Candidatus Weimeria sp. HCP3S3_B5 TaxID=3438871 RepID=UPI002A9DAB9F|nr:endosialidase [Lachnospiraceae bacterium]MDY6351640.1 endosialidase [Lachnospiraceae bacterium]
MAEQLIRSEKDGSLSFGDYTLDEKTKVKDFKYKGDLLYVKSYKTTTKLEKNDLFVYESEPGTRVSNMKYDDSSVSFKVEGNANTDITVGLAPETNYQVSAAGEDYGVMKTGLGGKITLSIDLSDGKTKEVSIKKD